MNESIQAKKEDKDILFIMHLSQLLNLVTAIGGLIAPIIIWALKKEEVVNMDKQGKEVINFQITMLLAYIVSFLLIFVFFIGVIFLIALALINIIIPIIQAINAKDGKPVSYPFSLKFLY